MVMITIGPEPGAEDASTTDACCPACALRETRPEGRPVRSVPKGRSGSEDRSVPRVRALPMIEPTARPSIARGTDRRIAYLGLLVAAAFFVAAPLGLAHLVVGRSGLWVPLHLALAGSASTAVASVLPFFAAALAAAPPVRPQWRIAGIGAVASGALVVSLAVPTGRTEVAIVGGLVYITGIGAVAVAALAPLRGALGIRRPLIEAAYGLALAQVAVGVLLAVGMIAGVAAVAGAWATLKPAHAWLNVFGFLAVVIAATLVHLAPTVVGSRIRPRASAVIAVVCLVSGPPSVAIGMAVQLDPLVRVGAAVELLGAMALVAHGIAIHRDGARWTTDLDWHRFTGWSLLLAPGWLLVAVALAAVPLLRSGADPAAWSVARIAAPLAIGFVGQILVGSWSHLLPAIGPGDQAAHARRRATLGRWAGLRVVGLNAGTLAAAAGATLEMLDPMSGQPMLAAGLIIAVASLASSVMLLVQAALPSPSSASRPRAAF